MSFACGATTTMPPRASTSKRGAGQSSIDSKKPSDSHAQPVPWPQLQVKTLGPPEWLIPDQVALLPGFLTAKECAAIVSLGGGGGGSASGTSTGKSRSAGGTAAAVKGKSNGTAGDRTSGGPSSAALSMAPSPPAKRGEAVRTNHRASTIDPAFSRTLFELGIDKAVANWPSQDKPRKGCEPKRPAGLHANIRLYRYDPAAVFGPHYDQSSICPATGLASEWTLLVYLSGPESGLTGGQTVFYANHSASSAERWEVEPQTGLALLHRHGAACMLHEALPPRTGTKWVLRSDLLFR